VSAIDLAHASRAQRAGDPIMGTHRLVNHFAPPSPVPNDQTRKGTLLPIFSQYPSTFSARRFWLLGCLQEKNLAICVEELLLQEKNQRAGSISVYCLCSLTLARFSSPSLQRLACICRYLF